MEEIESTNRESVLLYLRGAHDALDSARYNLAGDYHGVAVNRAYYVFFYAATALLFTLDVSRSKHSGVLAAFREHFVKPGLFSSQDSRAYGEAFALRNITDYEMLGQVDDSQAQTVVDNATQFLNHVRDYLSKRNYLI